MRVSGVMTRDVRIATPDQTLQEAARMMAERMSTRAFSRSAAATGSSA
jgi:CBS domain-containing protein